MKIAISSGGASLDSPFEPRFGRVPGFVLYDTEFGEVKHVDNTENIDREKGAGIKAAQAIAEYGAEVLLTGKVGPKAMRVLEKKNIRLVEGNGRTVREALIHFGIELPRDFSAGVRDRQGGTGGFGPESSGKGRGMGGGGRGRGPGNGGQGQGGGARGRGPEKGGRGAGSGGRGGNKP